MSQVRLLFDSVIEQIYEEKKTCLNLEVVYETLYLDLCGLHENILSMKKNRYPLTIFKYSSIANYYQLDLCENELQEKIDQLKKSVCSYLFPLGWCVNPRCYIVAALFEIYFAEDILKFNNGKLIITYMSIRTRHFYNVTNKYSYVMGEHIPDNYYVLDVYTQLIFETCIRKNETPNN